MAGQLEERRYQDSKVTELANDIQKLTTEFAVSETKIDSLTSRFEKFDDRYTNHLAEEKDRDTQLAVKVGLLDKDVTGVSTTVAKLDKKMDSFDERISAVEKKIIFWSGGLGVIGLGLQLFLHYMK